MSANPLLSKTHRIPFDVIGTEHVLDGVETAIAEAKSAIAALVEAGDASSFARVMDRLDEITEAPEHAFRLASHLNGVANTPEMREAYGRALPQFVAFVNGLLTDQGLWRLLKTYAATPEARALTGTKRRHLEKTLEEFRRAGADLAESERRRAEALQIELASLQQKFANNVLDSQNAFELLLEDESELAGLPEGVVRRARADAEARGLPGWRFTLQAPSYVPFMKYAADRSRRREMQEAFMAVATSGEHDNRGVMAEILAGRRELASVLGYRDFADYKLADSMVGSGDRAYAFVRELAERSRTHFEAEFEELEEFARSELGIDRLEPWDLAFTMERVRTARFDFDEEALRPYFPLPQVLDGVFALAKHLFGVRFEPTEGVPVWHEEVQTFDAFHEDGTHLGAVYTDWFPRETKRKGAWFNLLVAGGPVGDGFRPHAGVVAANFTPPEQGRSPLLTHDEVQTVFHEFGHLLHHLLCRVELRGRNSSSVPWDFIELPSQIMENWTWEAEALALFARHHETQAPLPEDLLQRLTLSRRFCEATAMMRQLQLGTADLALHIDFDPDGSEDPIELAERVTTGLATRPEFSQGKRMPSFTHVFSGGYAAGYYSYKWSEVLDADAFERFRAEGVLNQATGRDFAELVMARGDSADANELFRDFMGRDPRVDALLARSFGPLPSAGADSSGHG